MARPNTGILTVNEAIRLNIKDVRRLLLKQDRRIDATLTIGDRIKIAVQSEWINAQPSLRLSYSANGLYYDYRIAIAVRRSNLGVGDVMFFICPESGRPCRMLYMAYNYPKFKAREAYRIRIYYASQLTGGRSRFNDRYFHIEAQLDKLYEEQRQYYTHKGKATRRAERIRKLEEQQQYYDRLRWSSDGLPASIARFMS